MNEEEMFVNMFIVKNRRERLLYEFSRPDKRRNALTRFCHQAEDLIDPVTVVYKGNNLNSDTAVQFLKRHDGICQLMTPEEETKQLPFEEAVKELRMNPDAAIIAGNRFAAVKEEPPGNIWLLEKE